MSYFCCEDNGIPFCGHDKPLPGHLLPLRPGCPLPLPVTPNIKITVEMTFRTQMITELPADFMVAWDTSGDEKGTLWGGATDERITLIGDNASCAGGSAVFHCVGHSGETLNILNMPQRLKKSILIQLTFPR